MMVIYRLRKYELFFFYRSSSKYEDIIKTSVWIPSGYPVVYQLTTKMETIGNERRVTFGKKNVNKINKTILLVGETGAGKSTLINALLNYTMGVKWEDGVWFQIVEEKKDKKQTESQTSDVMVYEIFGFEDETLPYSLTIIDTPGFGNTREIKYDDIIFQRLFDLFRSEDGVHEVHAVGLVMKATDNRMSDQLIYVFDSVMSLFGKDLEEKIVALITHSNGRRPRSALQALEAANIKCAKNEENQPVYFLFDNCQQEDRKEEEKFLKGAHQRSDTGIREFKAFLDKTSAQKVIITSDVLNERIRLTECIKNLKETIKLIEQKQTEIKQTEEDLKTHEEEMKANKEFTVEVDEEYKDKEHSWNFLNIFNSEKYICCTVCENNCLQSNKKLEDCEVIEDGCCTVCTNKCPVSKHVKENWRYVTKKRRVQKTNEEMKERYEENKIKFDNKFKHLENLKTEMNQLTAEKSRFLDESYQHVVKLEEIALKADSASTIVHLDFLIEKMKQKGDTEKVQKLEEM
ncbi:uncharacterized protein LOC102300097, partial [Haplochromis burtoni]|uniref:uncharacterized protein LOC102300097 n=1 Tax=Haplochromis burtoni TaxID=8153 RepID=UPI001C2DD077